MAKLGFFTRTGYTQPASQYECEEKDFSQRIQTSVFVAYLKLSLCLAFLIAAGFGGFKLGRTDTRDDSNIPGWSQSLSRGKLCGQE